MLHVTKFNPEPKLPATPPSCLYFKATLPILKLNLLFLHLHNMGVRWSPIQVLQQLLHATVLSLRLALDLHSPNQHLDFRFR